MRLQQNQVWKQGDHYLRIVRLERMGVGYKTMKDLASPAGAHAYATKRDFCRLLKGATLMPLSRRIAPSEPADAPCVVL